MIYYVLMFMPVIAWVISAPLGALWLHHTRKNARPFAARPRVLTPLDDPMGSVIKLREWAEARALREVFPWLDSKEACGEWSPDFERQCRFSKGHSLERHSFEIAPPVKVPGNSMGMIETGAMTMNEFREAGGLNRLRQMYSEIMVLDKGFEYIPLGHPGHIVGFSDSTGKRGYRRYLSGIGFISAKTPEKLERACEVVRREHAELRLTTVHEAMQREHEKLESQLQQRYKDLELRLRSYDSILRRTLRGPADDRDVLISRLRSEVWLQMRNVIDELNALQGPPG
jgi:hypothetical protein